MNIPLSVPNLGKKELIYTEQAIKEGWVSTGGKFITKFEDDIAKYLGVKNAAACQSGTGGIHLSLVANKIGENDEVLVPTLTFVAAVNPIIYVRANPVFMDCDDSLCIDLDKVEKFCKEECSFKNNKLVNKKTKRIVKAIILVHIFGNLADIEKAKMLAKKYNLIIIEDATEALGTKITKGKYKGRHAGTIGDVGIFSFNGNKIITTGGGGMVVSNNQKLIRKIKYLSTQAKDDPLFYKHNEVGYNYRMTNIQAGIGIAQLEKLESFIETKKRNYELYIKNGIDLVSFKDNIRPNYWFYSYVSKNRDMLIKKLKEKGIDSRPIWDLIMDLPPYKKYQRYSIVKAKKYLKEIVNIPCSSNLKANEVMYVVKAIKEIEK